jgi:hypothetical protein
MEREGSREEAPEGRGRRRGASEEVAEGWGRARARQDGARAIWWARVRVGRRAEHMAISKVPHGDFRNRHIVFFGGGGGRHSFWVS